MLVPRDALLVSVAATDAVPSVWPTRGRGDGDRDEERLLPSEEDAREEVAGLSGWRCKFERASTNPLFVGRGDTHRALEKVAPAASIDLDACLDSGLGDDALEDCRDDGAAVDALDGRREDVLSETLPLSTSNHAGFAGCGCA